MIDKECKDCGHVYPIDHFYKNTHHDSRSNTCKTCKVRNALIKARTAKAQAVLNHGDKCFDCNQTYPMCVYEFHHLEPHNKNDSPSNLLWKSKKRFFAEVEKCVMLCANCHRIRHLEDREPYI